MAEHLGARKKKAARVDGQSTPSSNTELRLFISSTFIDFLGERDVLAKKVFPALRRLCRDRGVEFTEIDLRWGLTEEDSQQGRILRTCLEEVDNCRPFFIGLLGERYGWVPPIEELEKDPELREEQPWLEAAMRAGQSATELEFRHGFLNNDPGQTDDRSSVRPLVYCRSRPEQTEVDDRSSTEDPRITTLKREVVECLGSLPEFRSPEELASFIERDLTALIDRTWPPAKQLSWLEEERAGHAAFAQSRRKAYVPNPTLSKKLQVHLDNTAPVLVLTGESGSGKSSLLAYWAEELRNRTSDLFIIEHFIGVTQASTDPDTLVRRIIEEIRERTGADEPVPQSSEELVASLPSWLARVAGEPLLIIGDALNQLSVEGQLLRWLPEYLPDNIKWVFSSTEGLALDRVRARGWPEIAVKPLTLAERRKVLRAFLADYQKKLHTRQEEGIVRDPKAASPLFLRTLLEELRLQGKHEDLDRQIEHYLASADIPDLFTRILERVESDYGSADVRTLLIRLWAAPHGLSESEIIESCKDDPSSTVDDRSSTVDDRTSTMDRATLSLLLHAFDYHFVRMKGRLSFFHDHLRSAVERRYLGSISDKQSSWTELATYFQGTEASAIKAHSLPWLWNKAEHWDALKQSLLDIDLVLFLAEGSRTYDLLGYWLTLEKRAEAASKTAAAGDASFQAERKNWNIDVAAEYESALVRHLRRGTDDPSSVGLVIAQERNLRHTLTLFFRNSGWFEGAISNARRALELCQHEGRVDPELLDQAIDLSLDLGIACSDSGDLKGAADALAKAMQFVEERGHNFDMREIRVRSEYAKLLQEQGKYAEAESIHRVTVDAAVERLGQAHPTTQRAMKYLADVLALERKLPEAEALYRAILQRAELTMGPESLETAEALHELALFLRRVGGGLSLSELEAARTSHYEEARQLFERSAAIIETRLGEHHPDLGTMINNLASLHFECGSLSLAEPLFLKSLKIDELAHGPEHPKTATSLNNYASLLYREGKHNIAEPIYRRALAICRAALGEDHPETAISYNNLANDLYMQQHFDEAKACYDRALEIQLATIGPNHLHTGETFGSLGRLMRDTRDLPNAAEYLRHGYERRKEGLGLAHPNTIAGAVDLAEVLLDLSQTSMGDHAASAASILDDIRSAADTTTLREALRQRIDNLVARMALETLAD